MEIGAHLRDIREARGLSLRDIARTTKLSVSTLRCIERDDLERLPGGILRRGCLRSYAAAIGGGAGPLGEDFLARHPLTINAP
ncbi:MAG: helix-turn-helix domain-containing protein, partial [Acidobacteriota bacterium]